MPVEFKIGKSFASDMIKFLVRPYKRKLIIQKSKATPINTQYKINELAKELHPDMQQMLIDEVIEHKDADAKTFVLKAQNGKCAFFRAGQYVSVLLKIGDSIVTRPYSVCSSPKDTLCGKLAITVRRAANGFASDWMLENLKKGDRLTLSAPEGNFFYESLRDAKNVIALAGGSGITPFLSMAAAIRDGLEDFNLTILFGSRTESSILFKTELEKIAAECDKVKLVNILSDEEKDGYEHGFITAELIKKYAPEGEYSVFVCGSEGMYRFLEPELAKLNLAKKYIRRELLGVTKEVWTHEGYPQELHGKTFKLTVKQGPETFNITASADESLLAAIERAGIIAPSRCRSGECGFCRSRLISGEIFAPAENEGRRYADKASGYIHPCAAFPLSDIVIDVPGSYLK